MTADNESLRKVSDRLPTPAAHREQAMADAGAQKLPPKGEAPIDIQKLQANNPASWGDALRAYEWSKRHVIHPDQLKGPAIRIGNGQMKEQERVFDPILQKFRDYSKENGQREIEHRARIQHLNRAKDIQLLREQP